MKLLLTIFLFVAILGVCTPQHMIEKRSSRKPPAKMSMWGIFGMFNKFKQAYEKRDVLEMVDMGLAVVEYVPGLSPYAVLGIRVARKNIGIVHPAVLKLTTVMITVKGDLDQFTCPVLLQQNNSHISRMYGR